jgi:hypothetical protein
MLEYQYAAKCCKDFDLGRKFWEDPINGKWI